MKQLFFLIALLLPAFSFSQTVKPTSEFRYPGEWEPMEAIWIQPASKSFLAGPNVEPGMMNCIKELSNFIKVNIRVRNDTILQQTKARLTNYGIDMSKVNFIKNFPETGGFGTSRDAGPAFLINDNKEMMAVDFDYISMFGPPNERTALSDKRDRDWVQISKYSGKKSKSWK